MGCRNLKGLETLWPRQEIELNSEPPHDFVAGPGTVVSVGDPGKDWRAPGDQPAGPQHQLLSQFLQAPISPGRQKIPLAGCGLSPAPGDEGLMLELAGMSS